MRKLAISLLTAAVLMLAACTGKTETVLPDADSEQIQILETDTRSIDPSSELEFTGIYRRGWSEEIGGATLEMNAYIVLNEDGSGYWIAQDIGTLVWDADRLMLSVGGTYEIALTQESGTVNLLVYEFRDDSGEWDPMVFEKIEELPAEVEEMLTNP